MARPSSLTCVPSSSAMQPAAAQPIAPLTPALAAAQPAAVPSS
jgi:hypothetical protein